MQEYSEQGRAANAALVMTADEIKRLLAMASLARRVGAARATHALQECWLCPGRRPGAPMTARQSWRLFHETAEAAGIKKARDDAHVAPLTGLSDHVVQYDSTLQFWREIADRVQARSAVGNGLPALARSRPSHAARQDY